MLILVVAQTRETERVKLDLILLDLTKIDTKDITRTVKIVFLRNVIFLFYSRSYRIFLSSYRKQASKQATNDVRSIHLVIFFCVWLLWWRPYRTVPHHIASHRFHFIFVVMGGSTVQ